MSEARERRVIVVIGMGRSGTSAVSRGLMALGVYLGDNLISAAEINEKGFWEDADIVNLNDEIISACGKNMGSVDDVDLAKIDIVRYRELIEKAKTLLSRRYGDVGTWGFKDPRTVRILPFWQHVFKELGIIDDYVICYRNPVSVVASCSRISNQGHWISYVQWLNRSFLAVEGTGGKRRVVVSYDKIMSAPAEELKRLARALDITNYSEGQINDYERRFLTHDLRHSIASVEDLERVEGLPSVFLDLANFLESAARVGLLEQLDDYDERWREIRFNYRKLDAWRQSLDARDSEFAAVEEAKAWLVEQYATCMTIAENREKEIRALTEECARLTAVAAAVELAESQCKNWMVIADARSKELQTMAAECTKLRDELATHSIAANRYYRIQRLIPKSVRSCAMGAWRVFRRKGGGRITR